MDLFPLYTGTAGPPPAGGGIIKPTGLVMGYFDGNTVTAMWNYAQNFALSDNSYGTTFGPSTPGVLNFMSGQTNGAVATLNGTGDEVSDGNGGLTVIGDADPLGDVCSNPTRNQVQMGGLTIGDLLNNAGVTWGTFMGGFNLGIVNPNGTTGCNRSTTSNITGVTEIDYYGITRCLRIGLRSPTRLTCGPLRLLKSEMRGPPTTTTISWISTPPSSRKPPGSQFPEGAGLSRCARWLL